MILISISYNFWLKILQEKTPFLKINSTKGTNPKEDKKKEERRKKERKRVSKREGWRKKERMEERIQTRAEMYEVENKYTIERLNEVKG